MKFFRRRHVAHQIKLQGYENHKWTIRCICGGAFVDKDVDFAPERAMVKYLQHLKAG